MVKVLRQLKSVFHNLTKWLSRCECSFHKGKRKTQLYGEYDAKYGAELNKQHKHKRMDRMEFKETKLRTCL